MGRWGGWGLLRRLIFGHFLCLRRAGRLWRALTILLALLRCAIGLRNRRFVHLPWKYLARRSRSFFMAMSRGVLSLMRCRLIFFLVRIGRLRRGFLGEKWGWWRFVR